MVYSSSLRSWDGGSKRLQQKVRTEFVTYCLKGAIHFTEKSLVVNIHTTRITFCCASWSLLGSICSALIVCHIFLIQKELEPKHCICIKTQRWYLCQLLVCHHQLTEVNLQLKKLITMFNLRKLTIVLRNFYLEKNQVSNPLDLPFLCVDLLVFRYSNLMFGFCCLCFVFSSLW